MNLDDETDYSEIIETLTMAAARSMLDDEVGEDDEDQNPLQLEMIEQQRPSKKMKMKSSPVNLNEEKIINTLKQNIEKYSGHDNFHMLFLIELVKAVTINNAAKHFVGIQPMTGPVGLIYALINLEKPKLEDSEMIRGSLEILSHTVEAKSTELGFKLTAEAIADMSLPYVNGELLKTARDEISAKIYENIRNEIMKVGNKLEAKVDNRHDLMVLLGKCANEIGYKTKRGCGNFVIASQTIVNMLEKDLKVNEDLVYQDYGYVEYVGTVNGLRVYLDHDMDGNQTIVGYKGSQSEIDTGYIYCPYIPVQSSGVIVNPSTFEPLVRFTTRSGSFVNQKVTKIVSEDGSETTITREPCNYYVTLDIALPSIKFDDNTTVETVKNVSKTVKTVKDCPIDSFDAAMDLLD